LLLGVSHGAYLSYVLFKSNSRKNNANLVLSTFVLIFSLLLAFIFIDVLELTKQLPYIIGLNESLTFLLGPLLYIYVVRLTSPCYQPINYWHFFPFVVATFGLLPFLMESNEFKLGFLYDLEPQSEKAEQYISLYEVKYNIIAIGLSYTYLLFVLFRLYKYKQLIKDNFSQIEKINLKWLSSITITLVILVFVWCLDEAIKYNAMLCIEEGVGVLCQQPWFTSERNIFFVEIGIVLCIYFMSLYGIKQPEVFHNKIIKTRQVGNNEVKGKTTDLLDKSADKYKNSSLDLDLSLSVFDELRKLLDSSSSYLEPDFSLNQLSEQTGISKHHLSQAINQCAKQNFFDFINNLRIEQAKHLLKNNHQMNVLDVSLAAGFNSRSSFYNAFKKYTLMTPTQYRKLQKV
jgi:AraC-like DNA-binding protein